MAHDNVFVDSNVLLHHAYRDIGSEAPEINWMKHETCRAQLHRFQQENTRLWINGQVLREFWRAASLFQTKGERLSPEEIMQTLRRFMDVIRVVDETEAVREQLLTLVQEHSVRGLAVHDANIVATMLAHGIDTLYARDSGFDRYREHIIIITPQVSAI